MISNKNSAFIYRYTNNKNPFGSLKNNQIWQKMKKSREELFQSQ